MLGILLFHHNIGRAVPERVQDLLREVPFAIQLHTSIFLVDTRRLSAKRDTVQSGPCNEMVSARIEVKRHAPLRVAERFPFLCPGGDVLSLVIEDVERNAIHRCRKGVGRSAVIVINQVLETDSGTVETARKVFVDQSGTGREKPRRQDAHQQPCRQRVRMSCVAFHVRIFLFAISPSAQVLPASRGMPAQRRDV